MPPVAAPDAIEPVGEDALEVAEALPSEHGHHGITAEDGTLEAHLREVHLLKLDSAVSGSTLNGIHDRVHEESHAVDQ